MDMINLLVQNTGHGLVWFERHLAFKLVTAKQEVKVKLAPIAILNFSSTNQKRDNRQPCDDPTDPSTTHADIK